MASHKTYLIPGRVSPPLFFTSVSRRNARAPARCRHSYVIESTFAKILSQFHSHRPSLAYRWAARQNEWVPRNHRDARGSVAARTRFYSITLDYRRRRRRARDTNATNASRRAPFSGFLSGNHSHGIPVRYK